MKRKLLALLLMTATISSCSCINTQAKLKLPPELVVPTVNVGKDLRGKIPDEVIQRLKDSSRKKNERIETLKNIIKSTH